MTSLTVLIDNVQIYILVFVRFAGVLVFNPILARSNVPARIRNALAFGSAFLLAPNLAVPEGFAVYSDLDFALAIFRELTVGWLYGFVFLVYYYMLMFAGDVMDTQFGLSMSKVMDPGTKVQTAFSGNVLGLLFMAYIFATNSHLVLIRLAATSYELVPIGAENLALREAPKFAISMFNTAFSLAIRLAFPFVAVELILEVSLGILMKLIPQIHVFVINMQFKIMLAIVLLFLLASPICVFLDNYILRMLSDIQQSLLAVTGG